MVSFLNRSKAKKGSLKAIAKGGPLARGDEITTWATGNWSRTWKSELDSFIVHHTQHSTGHIHCHLPVVEVKTYKAESTWCIQILSSQGVPRIFDCEGKLRTPSQGSPEYRFRASIATRTSPAKSNTMLEKKKKTFSFPGGGNCPAPAMCGPGSRAEKIRFGFSDLNRQATCKKKYYLFTFLSKSLLSDFPVSFCVDFLGTVSFTLLSSMAWCCLKVLNLFSTGFYDDEKVITLSKFSNKRKKIDNY